MIIKRKLIHEKIILKDLTFNDVLDFDDFGSHESRLYESYNLANMTYLEKRFWYSFKRRNSKRQYYSIKDAKSNILYGYLGIKNINDKDLSGELGIVLDPKFIGNGLGTLAMKILLDYLFKSLDFRKIILEVNQFNHRAIKSYEKLNFKFVTDYLIDFEVQDINIFEEEYKNQWDDFVFFDGVLYTKVHLMELTKENYFKGEENEI